MATIVNTPASSGDSNSGSSFLVGIVLLILFILALLYFGLPMLNRASAPAQAPAPQVNAPEVNGPDVNIPDQIDVNVNDPAQ